ncbi:hypothetical protein ACWDUN_00555 [Mycobacterium sp. NPDC003323]
MTEQPLTPADAALRARITELSVHIPCGTLRGPVYRRWQSCRHEDRPSKWEGHDVSREHDLCIVCFRGTAGGSSRWSWLACEHCRAVNTAHGRPLPLGRHSIMNGIVEIHRLVEFAGGDWRLNGWREHEYRLMALRFEPDADVPLREWQQAWPPSRQASEDAFSRLTGL